MSAGLLRLCPSSARCCGRRAPDESDDDIFAGAGAGAGTSGNGGGAPPDVAAPAPAPGPGPGAAAAAAAAPDSPTPDPLADPLPTPSLRPAAADPGLERHTSGAAGGSAGTTTAAGGTDVEPAPDSNPAAGAKATPARAGAERADAADEERRARLRQVLVAPFAPDEACLIGLAYAMTAFTRAILGPSEYPRRCAACNVRAPRRPGKHRTYRLLSVAWLAGRGLPTGGPGFFLGRGAPRVRASQTL